MTALSNQWFQDAVSALAYSLAQPHETAPHLEPPHNDLTRFILAQHGQMPDYLRTPLLVATLLFDTSGFLKGGKRWHRQVPSARQKQILRWKDASAGFQRDLLRYFESLTTLVLYSRRPYSDPGSSLCPGMEPAASPESVSPWANIIEAPPQQLTAEIVVVGSGPGGAITACLLAEAGRDVLLVEEGPFLSLESCKAFSQDEMLKKYRNGGQTVALGKNKIAYVEGRCVGGGSEINSGLYHRTPGDVLECWRREFQVEALTEPDLIPHFEKCERELSVSRLLGTMPAASRKLEEGAAKLGWQCLEIPRWFRYDNGADGKPGKGRRQSMTETYIPRFLRAGGRLLPRTRALRLRQNGTKWTIKMQHEAAVAVEVEAGEVFLCAGAVHSPALLRHSGITNRIGNSLQVHPTIKIVATFKELVNSEDMGVPVHQVKEFSPRLSFGCSLSSPGYLALGLIDHPDAARATWRIWGNTAIYYAMITSEGCGSVRPVPDFRDPMVRYVLTERDRRNLADGLRKLARLLFAAGATALYPTLARGPVWRCSECMSKLPEILPDGLANLMTIHLFSSCPMGEDRARCATDSFGKVHGFKNLFVSDASLLCTAPGVNPQGSIMALARRNALHYLETNR
jgi:choline dehydrogenase-like flavoprotein